MGKDHVNEAGHRKSIGSSKNKISFKCYEVWASSRDVRACSYIQLQMHASAYIRTCYTWKTFFQVHCTK